MLRSLVAMILGAALPLLVPSAAAAADWRATFVPQSLKTYLPATPTRFMVVAAGEELAAARQAAQALGTALTKSGKAALVMSDSALGDVAALDDPAIVKKCADLPIDRVITVRAFNSDSPADANAELVILDKQGKVQNALNAKPGQPIQPSSTARTSDAASGITKDTTEVVTQVTNTDRERNQAARKQYEERRVWFEDTEALAVYSNGLVQHLSWTTPYLGKYKRPLEGSDFYETVGRPDLASSYRRRVGTKWGIRIAGFATSVAGLVLSLTAIDSDCSKDKYGIESCKLDSTRVYAGGAMVGGGLVLSLFAGFIDSQPISAPEARALADMHNQRLRLEMKLADDEPGSRPQRRSLTEHFSAGVLPTQHGASAALGFAF